MNVCSAARVGRLCARLGLPGSEMCASILDAQAASLNFCAMTNVAALHRASAVANIFSGGHYASQLSLHPGQQFQQVSCFSAAAGYKPPSREQLDLQNQAAIDEIWPSSRRQRILAAKVQSALEEVLMHNPTFREQLVGVCGFTVRAVRMSPDNMKAFVLWRAYPDCEAAARVELNRNLKTLRAAAARRLQLRHMPRLEMRHDSLTDQEAHLEQLLDSLKAEREAEADIELASDGSGFFDDEPEDVAAAPRRKS